MEREKRYCGWIRKDGGRLQLQSGLWWVATVNQSKYKRSLMYWKVVLHQEVIQGYSNSENEAIKTVEALIKTDNSYEYKVKQRASVLVT